ncbi:PorP/SprF family type IX secretion system membrane protein [Maribacter sp. CXY002]|uniref:PorP/SprF family type IX secretion system membrane protein n=1 Tax=Maribacter luteocoastalis TaxID=3407671 RepID=UPI003B67C589
MKNFCGALLIGFVVFGLKAQEAVLPSDFRQHNLTEYNSSLLNPAYALGLNNPSSLAFWSRWQWQTFDADPTTLFLNYTGRLNESSVVGVGFFQHNTGSFLNTGGAINYAYNIVLGPKASLGVGLNVFAFKQKLADTRFFQPNLIQTEPTNDFVLQMAPGINVRIDRFSIGFASENLFDYNFSTNERNTSPEDRVVFGAASYDVPISLLSSDNASVLRPTIYFKSIPGLDTQIGLNTLLSTNKYWTQLGYNSFYGISGGVGGRFFKRFSFGAIVEFGTGSDLKGQDPTFELVTSYKLGTIGDAEEEMPKEELIAEVEEEMKIEEVELTRAERLAIREAEKEEVRLAKINLKREKDSITEANKLAEIAQKEELLDAKRKAEALKIEREKQALAKTEESKQRQMQDSLNAVKKAREDALAIALQKEKDSIAGAKLAEKEAAEKQAELERLAQRKEVVTPQAGEKYEEVTKQGSLEPGYYLIANVFGTKRYFEAFMADLKKKGLSPGSFYRDLNKYNYVYLARYNSINEARTARDSRFNGKYTEKTWIFRVVGE